MDAPLRQQCELLLEELARAGRADAKARYELGAAVHKIREGTDDTQGERRVSLMARALGFDRTTLYKFADVAKVWPEWSAVNELLKRRSVTRIPISFSHLARIATVQQGEERNRLIDAVLTEGLNVRELERQIVGISRAAATGEVTTESSGREPPWFRSVRTRTEALHDEVAGLEAEIDMLEQQRHELVPDLAKLLGSMADQQEDTVSRLTRAHHRLRTLLLSGGAVESSAAA